VPRCSRIRTRSTFLSSRSRAGVSGSRGVTTRSWVFPWCCRADNDAELDGLFVEPSAWRHGTGRALVEAACARARSEGARLLHVIAGREAAAFYQACGFELLGEARTRFGTALAMRRMLANPVLD
jgi:GNAT superfamily N-acetyltransferase